MAAPKKSKTRKLPLILVSGIILLTISALQTYRILQPAPVHAPVEPSSPKPEANGIYKGDLPCADCPGIVETLILAKDGSYILEDVYKEKSTKPYQTQGKWETVDSNIIKTTPEDKNSNPGYFQILENGNLQMLDSNMQKIDSPFNQILAKQN